MSIGKIIVLAFVFISAVVFAVKMIYGFKKGMGKAIISLVCVLLAALLTFILATPIANLVSGIDISGWNIKVGDKPVSNAEDIAVFAVESIGGNGQSIGNELMKNGSIAASVKEAPSLLASIVVGPLFFLFVFLILRIAMIFAADPILYLITKDRSERPKLYSKFAGMGIGFVSALLFCGIMFMTVFGVVSVTKDAVSREPDMQRMFGDLSDSFFVKAYSALGFDDLGVSYMRGAAKIEIDTEEGKKTVYLADELSNALDIYSKIDGKLRSTANTDASQLIADSDFVYDLTDAFKQSDVFKEALPVVAKYAMVGAIPGSSTKVAKLDKVNNKDIDELLEVYNYMDKKGITQALADKDSAALSNIMKDVQTANELTALVKGSRLGNIIIDDAVIEAIKKLLVNAMADSGWEKYDFDRFISLIRKTDVDNIYFNEYRELLVLLVDNAELASYAASYDPDAEDLDRAALRRVISSLMTQYEIDGEDLFRQALEIRAARAGK